MSDDTAFFIVQMFLNCGWLLWFAGAFLLAGVVFARTLSREWSDVLRISAPLSVSLLYWWLIVNKYTGPQLLYAHEIFLLGAGYALLGVAGLVIAARAILRPSN